MTRRLLTARRKYALVATGVLLCALAYPVAAGAQTPSTITISGSMEGNLPINPGDTLTSGYDFTMPGSHAAAQVTVSNATLRLTAECKDGSSQLLTITMPQQTYTDPANSSDWYPSGDQSSPLVYQGSLAVPTTLCGGQQAHAPAGATFSALFSSTDSSDPVHIRMHYADNTSGSWSSTNTLIPVTQPVGALAGHIFDCVGGSPTTTEQPNGAITFTGEPAAANPVSIPNVAAGDYGAGATAPSGYEFVTCGTITYTVGGSGGTATYVTPVTVPANGTGTAVFYVVPAPAPPNCYPTKSVTPPSSPQPVGVQLTYTVTATGDGLSAGPCEVHDTFTPSGGATVTMISGPTTASGTVTSTAAPGFTWTIPSLAVGQTVTLTEVVQADSTGTLTNTATVPSSMCTPTAAHPCSQTVVTVIVPVNQPVGALAGHIYDCVNGSTTTSEQPSGTITFTGEPTSANPVHIANVPVGTYGASATAPSGYGFVACGTATYSVAGNGGTATYTTPVTVPANGTGTAIFYVVKAPTPPAPNCVPTKTVSPTGSVAPGTDLTYTVTLTNNGGAVGSCTLADAITLAGGATYSIVSGPTVTAGHLTGSNPRWSWTVPQLAPGTTDTLTLVIDPLTIGTITNTAVVPPSECSSHCVITVPTPVTLQITKTVSETSAHIGDTLTYTVVVTNTSQNPATNVVVDDAMSGTAGYSVNDGTNGTTDSFAGIPAVTITKLGVGQYRWSYSSLAAGQSGMITYTAVILAPGTVSTTLNGTVSLVNTAATPGLPPATVTTTAPFAPGGVLAASTSTPNTGAMSELKLSLAVMLLLGGLGLVLVGLLVRTPPPAGRRAG